MRKRVNIEELIVKLNEFRKQNLGKSYTSGELLDKLVLLGFNKSYGWGIMSKAFPHEKIGLSNLYSVPKEPIHINVIKSIVETYRANTKKYKQDKIKEIKEKVTEEEALNLLSSKGYQIRKCVGFDLDRFAKENPGLYKKYLKYEII